MLAEVGVTVLGEADQWTVDSSTIAAHDWTIEPDLSNAGPFWLRQWSQVPGSPCSDGLPTTQTGDYWRGFLRTLGAEVRLDNDGLRHWSRLRRLRRLRRQPAGGRGTHTDDRGAGGVCTDPEPATRHRTSARPRDRPDHRDRHRTPARRVAVETTDDGLTIDPSGGCHQRRRDPDVRRSPHGDHGRGPGAADTRTAGRRSGHHHQNDARFRRDVGDDAPVSRRDLDEDDVRVRPSGHPPAAKVRLDFSKALPGTVIAVDRGRFTSSRARSHGDCRAPSTWGAKGLVVGDRVGIDGPLPESDDALVRIVTREPRRTELRRTADDTDPTERVIVANAGSDGDRDLRGGSGAEFRVHRPMPGGGLRRGVDPLLVLTKGDLGSPDEVLERYPGLGFQVIPTHRLPDRTLVFDGPLVESLAGVTPYRGPVRGGQVDAGQRAGARSRPCGGFGERGDRTRRHTSTSAYGFEFRGGLLIDTPGGSARSAWPMSMPTGSSTPSRTWPAAPRNAPRMHPRRT